MADMETVFTMSGSRIKYGAGATREVGFDMKALGAGRVLVITDPVLADMPSVHVTLEALRGAGVEAVLFDQVRVEPTDLSFQACIDFALDGDFDGFVAVGGGSSIDTAKAANLYASYPADFLTYVAPPMGRGAPVPGPLKPMIAIPTTAGTGSEMTGVAVLDISEIHVKTAISSAALRPALGVIDPDNTRTLPPMVAVCSGLDVLTHALESITALPYDQKPPPEHPTLRPPYQGANPISHIWASRAVEMVSGNLLRVIQDPSDDKARGEMILAATYAGIGFGNAGVHLPHAMSYPISGMVKNYVPEGYPKDHPMVPHGMSVALNAPAVFRFTAEAAPHIHLHATQLMGVDTSGAGPEDSGALLSDAIARLMRHAGMPNGLAALGFGPENLDQLVAGTMAQERITKLSPRPAGAEDLKALFLDAMEIW
jgi:hydroxyacid-oxoacid transhydrogenase